MHVRVRKRGVKKRGLSGWAAEGGTRARGERRAGVDRAGAPGGRYRVPAVAYSVGRSAAAADIQRVLALRSALGLGADRTRKNTSTCTGGDNHTYDSYESQQREHLVLNLVNFPEQSVN